MNGATNNFELLYEKAKRYTETSIELYKLYAVDKAADLVSSLAVQLALLLFVALFTLFVNIGISFWLGDLLDSVYLGFFIVSFFYLFMAIVIYIYGRKFIKVPLTNIVIEKLLTSKATGTSILDQFKRDVDEQL